MMARQGHVLSAVVRGVGSLLASDDDGPIVRQGIPAAAMVPVTALCQVRLASEDDDYETGVRVELRCATSEEADVFVVFDCDWKAMTKLLADSECSDLAANVRNGQGAVYRLLDTCKRCVTLFSVLSTLGLWT
jgi:hypothetical protein